VPSGVSKNEDESSEEEEKQKEQAGYNKKEQPYSFIKLAHDAPHREITHFWTTHSK